MTDEQFGRLIRAFIAETGQAVCLMPDGEALAMAALMDWPDEDQMYLVGRYSLNQTAADQSAGSTALDFQERVSGFEPLTCCLGSNRSTPEVPARGKKRGRRVRR